MFFYKCLEASSPHSFFSCYYYRKKGEKNLKVEEAKLERKDSFGG